ncbi:Uncharacterised protein [Achromobacter insolitus]|uniref:hypothetical protein n=1 Tax=Achromobacter insolitus TaxID=217204 RepID=UPI000972AC1D|nr:hypothetical protein [Achromobacter insolitus]APX75096.1 hypothetical protein BUW96_09545 [Achromobacter insolitus]OWT58748.1 hypothetical protein CEY08_18775 [Achromobacter insolitus]CAB3716388.1 hypothetical protein LMG6003_03520 [Achromobacter insolitus]VEG67739.1 Uncharacterised protein [Achromobacter insolitus]
MTTSYSDQILQALAKHGRLNCQQLANKISHDSKKTTQLVSFMRTNKKVKTDGQIDGLAAYSLTDLGRSLVPVKAPRVELSPTAPSSLDDLADAQLRPVRPSGTEPQSSAAWDMYSRAKRDSLRQVEQSGPAFGLLNTREFLIMFEGHMIKIPAENVPAMRAQLNTPAAGAFQ